MTGYVTKKEKSCQINSDTQLIIGHILISEKLIVKK